MEESHDALVARHHKEQRDLQAKITSKKKSATKKTRRGVNDDCAALERELKERQAAELAAREGTPIPPGINGATSIEETGLSAEDGGGGGTECCAESHVDGQGNDAELVRTTGELKISGTTTYSPSGDVRQQDSEPSPRQDGGSGGKKPNRQKARLARRAAEQEAAASQAAQEAASLPDLRAQERDTMALLLRSRGLVEHEVRSDGHCLYAAMADQLSQLGEPLARVQGEGGIAGANGEIAEQGMPDYKAVRRETAAYVLAHRDDFVPFLDETEMEKGVEEYARKIRETGEWGGQMEILACARRWRVVVNVLQGDGRVERIEGVEGDVGHERECWLAYYRHSFGLGEHYNSLRRKAKGR